MITKTCRSKMYQDVSNPSQCSPTPLFSSIEYNAVLPPADSVSIGPPDTSRVQRTWV